jgi:hypothetical protein
MGLHGRIEHSRMQVSNDTQVRNDDQRRLPTKMTDKETVQVQVSIVQKHEKAYAKSQTN